MLRIHYHAGEEGIETRKRFVIPDINRGIAEELRERERDQDRRDRPRARKTVQDKVLLFFLAAKPFFPSFFPRLLPIPLSEFMRNLMARGKDKDLSLRDE